MPSHTQREVSCQTCGYLTSRSDADRLNDPELHAHFRLTGPPTLVRVGEMEFIRRGWEKCGDWMPLMGLC